MSAHPLSSTLLALAAVLAASVGRADDAAETCRLALEKAYPPGVVHGVILQPEVPTRRSQDLGIVKHDRQFEVDVVDGDWRHSDSANVATWEDAFRRGEVVRLTSLRCVRDRVDMRFVSTEDHYVPAGLLGEHKMRQVATTFRIQLSFRPRGDVDVPRVVAHLAPLVNLQPSLVAAKKFADEFSTAASVPAPPRPSQAGEVQRGMSQEEVLAMLGAPLTRSTKGAEATWNYPERVVRFRDSHVVEVISR